MENFEQWLTRTQKTRDALFEYAKSEMPTEQGLLSMDLDKCIRAEGAAGLQHIDADFYLKGETAQAVITSRDLSPDISAKEREIQVRDSVKSAAKLVAQLELLRDIFKARRIAASTIKRGL